MKKIKNFPSKSVYLTSLVTCILIGSFKKIKEDFREKNEIIETKNLGINEYALTSQMLIRLNAKNYLQK